MIGTKSASKIGGCTIRTSSYSQRARLHIMHPSISVPPSGEKAVRKSGRRDFALLLLVAWLVPLGVHLVPWKGDTPLTVSLLPVFWTALVAVYLYGGGVGLLTGLAAPLIDFLVMGFPTSREIFILAIEVTVFVAVLRQLIYRAPGFWRIAPFGYIVARVASIAMETLPDFQGWEAPMTLLLASLQVALPGLAMLAVINGILVKISPQPDDWDAT